MSADPKRAARCRRLVHLARISRSKRGVVSREHLRDEGFSDGWIGDRLREDLLRRVLPGVFAVGATELTREAMWHAALLYGGPAAALSHRTAAVVWGLLRSDGPRPEIIVADRRGQAEDRIIARRPRLAEDEVAVTNGFRVTTPMRTLIDLAAVADPATLAEAVNQALMRDLFDELELSMLMARARGRRGVAELRALLRSIGREPLDVRSRNEWRARAILVAAGVTTPVMNAPIALGDGRYRYADLYVADVRLDIEIDGPRHRLPHVAAADAVRDAELAGIGVTVERFPEAALDEPDRFAADVEDVIAAMRASRSAR